MQRGATPARIRKNRFCARIYHVRAQRDAILPCHLCGVCCTHRKKIQRKRGEKRDASARGPKVLFISLLSCCDDTGNDQSDLLMRECRGCVQRLRDWERGSIQKHAYGKRKCCATLGGVSDSQGVVVPMTSDPTKVRVTTPAAANVKTSPSAPTEICGVTVSPAAS